jgi:hypothetical protein
VFEKRWVYVTAEVLFQLHDSNPPVGTFICEWQETAAIPFSTAISRTTETPVLAAAMATMVSELAAFENHLGMQAGPSSGRQVCFRESSGLP